MPTSAASTITLHGGIRRRAARSSSIPSNTPLEPPSVGSSTSSSSPKALPFVSVQDRFSIRTSSVGPDTFTVLASLAAVTEHLGWQAPSTPRSTSLTSWQDNSRRSISCPGGRAAWNVVTSFDAFTGQNFRRGGYLDRAQRYERAEETVALVRQLWDSWRNDDIVADKASGRFLTRPDAGEFAFHGSHFDVNGRFTVPRSPQGRPVILQAGVSPQGRDFAAGNADAIFSPYGQLPEAADFYRDIKARAVAAGRRPG